jgi:hypothetical protein
MKKLILTLSIILILSCESTTNSVDVVPPTKILTPTAAAIKYYKDTFEWQNGFESWSKVPTTEDYHMLAPNLGLEAKGAKEIEEVIFGFVNETELKQELVDIIEHGNYITCLLKITTKTGETMDVVEVFLVDDDGKVKNIWAL